MRRAGTIAAVMLAGVLVLLGAVAVGRAAATSPDELRQMPLLIVTARRGDTWWSLAATCPVDRRVAVDWLAETAGVDPNAPILVGQSVVTCELVDAP